MNELRRECANVNDALRHLNSNLFALASWIIAPLETLIHARLIRNLNLIPDYL